MVASERITQARLIRAACVFAVLQELVRPAFRFQKNNSVISNPASPGEKSASCFLENEYAKKQITHLRFEMTGCD